MDTVAKTWRAISRISRTRQRGRHRRTAEYRAARPLLLETLERRELLAAHPLHLLPAANFSAGDSPNSVAVGDFNRDGWTDLATANELSNDVSVLFGNGGGSFSTPRSFATGAGPRCVMAGDLNGDGILDLVTSNPNNGSSTAAGNLSVLLGNGDGTFQTAVHYTAGLRPAWFTLADLNRDGHLDVAVANAGSNNLSVLLGTGTGALSPAVNYNVGKMPFSCVAADFNGDGHLDLVAANSNLGGIGSGSISVLLNRGNGTFTSFSANSARQGIGIIVAGDFNGDGNLDVAANSTSGVVSVYFGIGNGTFEPRVDYAVTTSSSSIATGDLDGDGHLDVVLTNASATGQIFVLRGSATGIFGPALAFDVGSSPGGLALADVDHDSQLDVIVPNNGADNVSVLLNSSAASRLALTGPVDVAASQSFTATLSAFNAADSLDAAYFGTVEFTSSDPLAVLPSPYTFVAADGGVHAFGVVFNTVGPQTLTVRDANNGALVSSISVVVLNSAPVAADDSAVTEEDTAVSITVLGNDTDADGQVLVVRSVTAPAHGTAAINSDGTITYLPGLNFNGDDAFSYAIDDGHGGMASANVVISVAPVNDAPVALDDSASTQENAAVTIDVLGNDTDLDGDPLAVSISVAAANGSAIVNANGTITYTPNANFSGRDSLTYALDDGHGGTATSSVTISVTALNDAPIARDDAATTREDAALTIDVLGNDSDVDGDALLVLLDASPSHGTVSVNANGTITYAPQANFNGEDSFTYSISDGHGGTASATVLVSVAPVNDAPTSKDDAAATKADSPVLIHVLANDTDPDGDRLTVSSVKQPARGSVRINADGTVTYTPTAGFYGSDAFSYVVRDPSGATSTATVRISVSAVLGTPGKVTGGGTMDWAWRNFGFNVQARQTAGGLVFDGHLAYQDRAYAIFFKATSISLLHIESDGKQAYIVGSGLMNGRAGYSFKVFVYDVMEPGIWDRFRIQITGPNLRYDSNACGFRGGLLDWGGNIQVHRTKPAPAATPKLTPAAILDLVFAELVARNMPQPAKPPAKTPAR